MANSLEMLISANPNLENNRGIVQGLANELSKYFNDMKINLNTSNAIKQIKVLKTEVDAATKQIKKMDVSIKTASGKNMVAQGRVDKNGNFKLSNVKEEVNANKIANEYLSLVKQIGQRKKELNKIKLQDSGTTESIKSAKLLEKEIDNLIAKKKQLSGDMKSSGLDFSETYRKGWGIETANRVSMNQDAASIANTKRNNTLREYNRLQQQTLSLQKMLVSEESKASNFTQNTKERQKVIASLNSLIQENINKMRQMEQANKGDSEAISRMKQSAQDYNRQLDLVKQQTQAAQSVNNSFFQNVMSQWKEATARVVNYTVAYRSLWMLMQGFKDGVQTIEELNKAFTDIQMVTGYTSDQINKLSSDYGVLAKKMGATIDEVAEGATEWLRQGKSVQETNDLLEQSLIFSKVGAMTSAEATEYLTSTLNGYKMEVSDASKVVDVFSKLDMEAATSSKELAIAFSRTANSAADAGIPFEQLAALITTVSETTRKSASSIGESFKTLAARYANVKIGKFYDDDTGEAINDVEKVLSKFGIAMRESETEWRSMGEVIEEIGTNWKDYNDLQQNAIVTALAGKQQAENLRAAFNNYNKVLQYTESAYSAAGSSAEKYGIYLDSIEAKQKQLTATFQDIAYQPGFESLYKMILDLGIAFGDFLGQILKTPTALLPVVTAMGAMVAPNIMSGLFRTIDGFSKYGEALTKVSNVAATSSGQMTRVGFAMKGLTDAQKISILTTQTLSEKQMAEALVLSGMTKETAADTAATIANAKAKDVAAGSTIKWGNALKGLWATLSTNPLFWVGGAVALLFAAIKAYEKFIPTTEKSKEALEAASQEYDNAKSKLNSLQEELKSNKERIEELQNSGPLNLIEQAELKELQQANALLANQIELAKELEDVKKREKSKTAREALTTPTEEIDTGEYRTQGFTGGTIKERVDVVTKLRHMAKEYNDAYGKMQDAIRSGNKELADEYGQSAQNIRDEMIEFSNTILEFTEGLTDSVEDQALKRQVQQDLQDIMGHIGVHVNVDPDISFTGDINKKLEELAESFSDKEINIPIRIEGIDELQYISFDDIKNQLSGLNDALASSSIDINEYVTKTNDILEAVEWSEFSKHGEDTAKAVVASFKEIAESSNGARGYVQDLYDSGRIGGKEFVSSLQLVGSQFDLIASSLQTMSENDTFGNLDGDVQATIQTLQEASNGIKDLESAFSIIDDNAEYLAQHLDEAGQAAFTFSDMGTEAFQQFTSDLASAMADLKTNNVSLFNELVAALDAQHIQLSDSMSNESALLNAAVLGDFTNTNAVINTMMGTLDGRVGQFTSKAYSAFTALGNAISGFRADINITPNIVSQALNILGSFFSIPTGKIEAKGTGKGLSGVGMAFKAASTGLKALGKGNGLGGLSSYLTDGTDGKEKKNTPAPASTTPPGGGGGSKGGGGGGKGGGGGSSKEEDVMEDYNNKIKELEHLIAISEAYQETYEIGTPSWMGEIDKQIDLNRQIQAAAHEQADFLRSKDPEKYKDEIGELQEKWWDVQQAIEGLNYDKLNEVFEHEADQIEHEIDLADKRRDAFDKGSEDWLKYSDDILDKTKDHLKLLEQYAKDLEALDPVKYRDRLNEIKEKIEEIKVEIADIDLDKVTEPYEYQKDLLETQVDILKERKKLVGEVSPQWNKFNNNQISLLKQQLKLIEKYIDNLKSLNDPRTLGKINEAIEEWYKLQNSIKDALEDRKKQLEDVIGYVSDVVSDEIDKLNVKKDVIKGLADLDKEILNLKDDMNDALAADNPEAAKIFEKQISYLEEQRRIISSMTNEEEKKRKLKALQLDIQNFQVQRLKQELDLMKKQRTVRVYHQDKGWVWEADHQATADKEKEILEAQTDAQLAEIDNQIQGWEDYKDKWEDVVNDYERNQKRLLAEQILGANAEQKILDQRLDVLDDFVKQWNALIASMDSISMEEYGAPSSSGVLNSTNVIKGIAATAAGGVTSALASKGTSSVSGTIGNAIGTITNKITSALKGSSSSSSSSSKSSSSSSSKSSGSSVIGSIISSIKTKHDGIESGLVNGLKIDPQREVLTKLALNEGVFTHEQMNNLSDNIKDLMSLKLQQIPSYDLSDRRTATTNATTINFDKLVLPSVKNGNDFLNELRNIVSTSGKLNV